MRRSCAPASDHWKEYEIIRAKRRAKTKTDIVGTGKVRRSETGYLELRRNSAIGSRIFILRMTLRAQSLLRYSSFFGLHQSISQL